MFSPLSLLFLSVLLFVSLLPAQCIFPSCVSSLYPFSQSVHPLHSIVLCLLSIHLPLWPSLCLPAHIYTLQLPPPPFPFFSMSVFFSSSSSVLPSQQQQQPTIFCTMPKKQPSECCRLLWYPAAIVIGSHYSWDLQFNPGYVIGLLSSVQASLTPQTSTHLGMMRRAITYQQTRAS